MPKAEIFALKDSGLHAFLFADVGVERNGSNLTILSTLARLGKDPWAVAARWAQAPSAGVIEALAKDIASMPLSAQALRDARATASRLVLLLPTTAPDPSQRLPIRISTRMLPHFAWILVGCVWLYVALDASLTVHPKQSVVSASQTAASNSHPSAEIRAGCISPWKRGAGAMKTQTTPVAAASSAVGRRPLAGN